MKVFFTFSGKHLVVSLLFAYFATVLMETYLKIADLLDVELTELERAKK